MLLPKRGGTHEAQDHACRDAPNLKAEVANFVGIGDVDPVWAPEGPSKLRAHRG